VLGETHVFIKKRKAGIDINTAVSEAVSKKHKTRFTVVRWHRFDRSVMETPADTDTAEDLSSQEVEAELEPSLQYSSLQQEHDKLVKEAARASQLDMLDRIVDVAVHVAGRLVKANTPHDDLALLTALCTDNVKRGQLQRWLTQSQCPDQPEEYAAHFDSLYHIRCGKCCVQPTLLLPFSFNSAISVLA